jgi:hypothetical protein
VPLCGIPVARLAAGSRCHATVCRKVAPPACVVRRPELRGHGVTVKRVQLAGKYGPRWTFAIFTGKFASSPE